MNSISNVRKSSLIPVFLFDLQYSSSKIELWQFFESFRKYQLNTLVTSNIRKKNRKANEPNGCANGKFNHRNIILLNLIRIEKEKKLMKKWILYSHKFLNLSSNIKNRSNLRESLKLSVKYSNNFLKRKKSERSQWKSEWTEWLYTMIEIYFYLT